MIIKNVFEELIITYMLFNNLTSFERPNNIII